jgi:hypothetical protein
MKLLSLAFLAMASTAVAEETFELLMVTYLEGVTGNPATTACITAFETTAVDAYGIALPNADTQIDDVFGTNITSVPGLGSGTMGGYYVYSTSDNRCR